MHAHNFPHACKRYELAHAYNYYCLCNLNFAVTSVRSCGHCPHILVQIQRLSLLKSKTFCYIQCFSSLLFTGSSLNLYTCSEYWYDMGFISWSFNHWFVTKKAWISWLDKGHELNALRQQIGNFSIIFRKSLCFMLLYLPSYFTNQNFSLCILLQNLIYRSCKLQDHGKSLLILQGYKNLHL